MNVTDVLWDVCSAAVQGKAIETVGRKWLFTADETANHCCYRDVVSGRSAFIALYIDTSRCCCPNMAVLSSLYCFLLWIWLLFHKRNVLQYVVPNGFSMCTYCSYYFILFIHG